MPSTQGSGLTPEPKKPRSMADQLLDSPEIVTAIIAVSRRIALSEAVSLPHGGGGGGAAASSSGDGAQRIGIGAQRPEMSPDIVALLESVRVLIEQNHAMMRQMPTLGSNEGALPEQEPIGRMDREDDIATAIDDVNKAQKLSYKVIASMKKVAAGFGKKVSDFIRSGICVEKLIGDIDELKQGKSPPGYKIFKVPDNPFPGGGHRGGVHREDGHDGIQLHKRHEHLGV